MSFSFEWPTFSDDFYVDAREMLAQALNKGETPPIIADRIEVTELNMGTIPPELEILEIGDLSTDRFRGIFRLTYAGDAYIVLQTKVQANPLNVPRPTLDVLGTPQMLFAAAPLVVPMTLRLSSLSLRAIVVLVVSRQKGITLVFKNDPLESVNVSSSFDGVESVAGFIQKEIEGQLREAFRSDLPSVIHRLSQKWLSGEVKSASEGTQGLGGKAAKGFDKEAKIETRTAYVPGPDGRKQSRGRHLTTRLNGTSISGDSASIGSDAGTSFSAFDSASVPLSARRHHRRQMSHSTPSRAQAPIRDTALESVPESIEHYDPTYGLRPESIPQHAGFARYERLVRSGSAGRGLGDVLGNGSDSSDDDYEGDRTGDGSFDFDIVGLRDLVDDDMRSPVPQWEGATGRKGHRPQRSYDSLGRTPYGAELETIPAVGGGTITRPRVLHTQSQMRTRPASTGSLSAHGSPSTTTARVPGSASSTIGEMLASPPPSFRQMIEDRQDFARNRPYAASGTSTPRFPFPKMTPGTAPLTSTPSLTRNNSTFSSLARARAPHQLHRSNLSFSSMASTSADHRNHASSLFPSTLASAYSSPPSSVTSPKPPPVEEEEVYPPPRPDVIDLLSRSPSSVLEDSFAEDLMSITVNPNGNDSCAHLATLTHSNQTLSPFTRSHEHFTARSSPHVLNRLGSGVPTPVRFNSFVGNNTSGENTPGAADANAPPVKAKRKRVHRVGSANTLEQSASSVPGTPRVRIGNGSSSSLNGGSSGRGNGHGSTMGSGGGGGGGGSMGMRASTSSRSRTPSELSSYFPAVPDALAEFRRRVGNAS